MKKILLIPVLIIIFILGYYSGIIYSEKKQAKEKLVLYQGGVKTVNLMIDYGDARINTYNNEAINKEDTVFSLLKKISEDNDFLLEYKDHGVGMGVFIESINGYKNDYGEDKYWQYWIDGEYAKVGASNYLLEGGEVIEWKYAGEQINY